MVTNEWPEDLIAMNSACITRPLLAQYGEDLIVVTRSKDGVSAAAITKLGAMDFGAKFGHVSARG